MPPSKVALRLIGLTRKSRGDDQGTHADQRRIIESRVAASSDLTLLRVEQEHQVSGAKDWRSREIGRAIEDIRAGTADGVIVAYQDRITRERLAAAAEIWEALQEAGAVFIACDGTDSRAPGSELLFTIKAALAREQWKTYQARSNDGRKRAVVEQGVHGGEVAPQGYVFSERADGSRNASGRVKHGPLERDMRIDPITGNTYMWERIPRAYECRVSGGSWKQICEILGVLSPGNAAAILRNPVYKGQARSGTYVKEGAHPALVSQTLFDRVQRSFLKRGKRGSNASWATLAKVLRCGTCGSTLTPDISRGKQQYRCKNISCNATVRIDHAPAAEAVTAAALEWHRQVQPQFGLAREVENAMLPALEDTLAEAQAKVDQVEAMQAESDPADWLVAMGAARTRRDKALSAVDDAYASQSWLSIPTEKVREQINDGKKLNSFLRETVRGVVRPVGSGNRIPAAERLRFQFVCGSAETVVKTGITAPGTEKPFEYVSLGVGVPMSEEQVREAVAYEPKIPAEFPVPSAAAKS